MFDRFPYWGEGDSRKNDLQLRVLGNIELFERPLIVFSLQASVKDGMTSLG